MNRITIQMSAAIVQPHDETKALIMEAFRYVRARAAKRGIKKRTRSMRVKVQHASWSRSGRYCGDYILLRYGDKLGPCVEVYGRFKDMPRTPIADWREAVLHLAAHEFGHALMRFDGTRLGERQCELLARDCIRDWRDKVGRDQDTCDALGYAAEARKQWRTAMYEPACLI